MRSFLDDVAVLWRWERRIWATRPWLLAWILGGSFLTAGLLVTFPWLWQYVIEAVRTDADPVRLWELAGWMLAVGVAHAVLYLAVQGARALGNAVVSRFARSTVLGALVDAKPDALRAWRTGELVSRLHDDAGDKASWFLCSGIFRAWEAVLVASGCLVLMAASEPGLAVWVIGPLPVLLLAQAAFQGTLSRRHRAVQRAIAATSDQVTTTFGAIRVVQSSGLVPTATARFAAAATRERDAEVRAAVVQQGVQILYQYGWQLALGALLLFGGLRVLDGDLTLGRYVTFEGLLATMVWPMFDLGTLVSKVPQAAVALRRLDALDQLPAADAPTGCPPDDSGPLQAVGLTVVAEDGTALLTDISLSVAPGETVAVVGEVGAGKTVLVQTLTGLRAPTRGSVRLGDTPLSEVGPGAAGHIAVVPQDPALLSGTVRENVLLGRQIDDDALAAALRVSQLDRDLQQLADGLDTVVGERGVALSGGQKQRVALARALAGRPGVLVLDDATSALDAEVEAAFWDALGAELPGVGALLVTHRLATLATAARIVVLDEGRVVQRGSHGDLITTDGPYRRIYGKLRAAEHVEG